MKPFNLEEAKAGKPVCTANGLPARILCFDKAKGDYPIVALIQAGDGKEFAESYTQAGRYYCDGSISEERDLFMATITKTVWVNLYQGAFCAITGQCATYPTEEEARRVVIGCARRDSYIGTYPLTYEE